MGSSPYVAGWHDQRFNLLDNVDGLAAGLRRSRARSFADVVAGASPPVLIALAALVGLPGFLVYNFHPASIFTGTAAAFSRLLPRPSACSSCRSGVWFPFAAACVLLLLVPIFDTTFVTMTRIMAGRSPIAGGHDHTSHRLIALGIGERRAVLVHYLLTGRAV
jgi:UDP-GlcNAc:undecaprenyl-phosphate GlcNAc-1-phosphate transferase